MSSACNNPSIPSSSSTKAPTWAIFTTFPFTKVPGAYFSEIESQGFSVVCLRPSETLPA